MGRMPTENGLPQYVSRYKDGTLRYYRRPPTGVAGAAFVRSFGSTRRTVMLIDYPSVHTEAESYFSRLISGRSNSDDQLMAMVCSQSLALALHRNGFNAVTGPEDWDAFIANHGTPEMKGRLRSNDSR